MTVSGTGPIAVPQHGNCGENLTSWVPLYSFHNIKILFERRLQGAWPHSANTHGTGKTIFGIKNPTRPLVGPLRTSKE